MVYLVESICPHNLKPEIIPIQLDQIPNNKFIKFRKNNGSYGYGFVGKETSQVPVGMAYAFMSWGEIEEEINRLQEELDDMPEFKRNGSVNMEVINLLKKGLD